MRSTCNCTIYKLQAVIKEVGCSKVKVSLILSLPLVIITVRITMDGISNILNSRFDYIIKQVGVCSQRGKSIVEEDYEIILPIELLGCVNSGDVIMILNYHIDERIMVPLNPVARCKKVLIIKKQVTCALQCST